jgi:Protein of unknown function (DUF2384)
MQDPPCSTTPNDMVQALASKAAARAACRLGIDQADLQHILNLPTQDLGDVEAAGETTPATLHKTLDFIRLYGLLDRLTLSNEASACAWMRNDNLALGASPLNRLRQADGLPEVVAYLEARQALT